ncbi:MULTISPECIES: arylamine N-acetyltransferase [Shouchella]|uniref:Arylamine N-acetyltransferase n=1 Tax=Shouchella hunanensis TaxID=766894 RepID=A0ABY7W082_9BACI|nr:MULTISPECIES: arylamine N-acetyltransferase [Shouchella]WDF02254.1 arylamine N-acetyltransferase [Shouchella hunanensis]GAF20758.1 hypothetical protein JCM19047_414 [Bacillus sp. JCM 19047]
MKVKTLNDYLSCINVAQQSPTLAFLKEICFSHLQTFPFENISKIYFHKQQIPQFLGDVETFLTHYDRYGSGGTCYIQNSILYTVLQALSFHCYLVKLGEIHMGIIVIVKRKHYYVDCGAAAPFFNPILLEDKDTQSPSFGSDVITFSYQGDGHYHYQRYLDGNKSGDCWSFNVTKSANFTDFEQLFQDSFKKEATFMKLFRCQLYQLNQRRSVSIVNNIFSIRYESGKKQTRTLDDLDELKHVLNEEFHLPQLPIQQCIEFLHQQNLVLFK